MATVSLSGSDWIEFQDQFRRWLFSEQRWDVQILVDPIYTVWGTF